MRTNTDINKIKEIARAFLYLDISVDESLGIPILKHPIISDVFQVYTDDTKDKEGNLVPQMLDVRKEEDLDKIRSQYLELINKVDKVSDLFMLINGPYTGVFFKFTKDYMCVEDYTKFLVELWTSMEYPNVDNNVTRREISGGALDGYTLVLLENMRVVVLEKINTKRGENNATYVLPLIKAVELAEQSNKSELRTEENVEVVNHVRNYGTNLMRKIGMLQEKTISRDNRNVTWIKALPEGHQDEANKMIAQIQENYDENRGR